MQSNLEQNVNDWLIKPVASNNGNLKIKYHDGISDYLYSDYCEECYDKIKEITLKNGNKILNEEEFKDRVIYLLYKYSQHELSGSYER
tara:strand:+ start:190 stop:453 length:264 start_codon:yes stop_codon:yes gene_type:complete